MSHNIPQGTYQIEDICRSILGMYKLKYSVLDSFSLKNIDAFHINFDSIMKAYTKYYSTSPELKDTDLTYTICSSMLNLVAHYRHYFSKNDMNTCIYMYMSKENKEFEDVSKLNSIICKYIPKVYFIKTFDSNTNVYMKYLCDRYRNNIILTKNIFDVLLVSDSTSVIKANKDKSVFYDKNNLYSKYLKKDYSGNISYELLPIVFSFTEKGSGCKPIKGIGPSKILKIMDKALENNLIVNSKYNSMDEFLLDVKDLLVTDYDTAVNNFK